MITAADVLEYWFGNDPDDAAVAAAKAPLWWGKSEATDREITLRFGPLLEQAIAGELRSWTAAPSSFLALVVVLDQFSRVVFRGTARAFAQDETAQGLASQAIARRLDTWLRPVERLFLYLPFEHAESLPLQERSVALYTDLAKTVAAPLQGPFSSFADFAVRHHAIVARFGRFPHRNAALGRASTPEETAFLATPNSSF